MVDWLENVFEKAISVITRIYSTDLLTILRSILSNKKVEKIALETSNNTLVSLISSKFIFLTFLITLVIITVKSKIVFIKIKENKKRNEEFAIPEGTYSKEIEILGSDIKVYDIVLMEDGNWYDVYSISPSTITLYKNGQKIPKTIYRTQTYKCLRFIPKKN